MQLLLYRHYFVLLENLGEAELHPGADEGFEEAELLGIIRESA